MKLGSTVTETIKLTCNMAEFLHSSLLFSIHTLKQNV